MIDWSILKTVFLDMDGTLLDLHFDNHFWLTHLPRRYAELKSITAEEASASIIPMIMSERGSLRWYCVDYWSDRLGVDINALKAELSDRIAWRPHAQAFLKTVKASGRRTVIVTNCHPKPLRLKLDATGLGGQVDRVLSTHDFGLAKEEPGFWDALSKVEPYAAKHTLLVDDSAPVLASAADAGIGQLLAILWPDTQRPANTLEIQHPAIHDFDEIIETISPMPSLT